MNARLHRLVVDLKTIRRKRQLKKIQSTGIDNCSFLTEIAGQLSGLVANNRRLCNTFV